MWIQSINRVAPILIMSILLLIISTSSWAKYTYPNIEVVTGGTRFSLNTGLTLAATPNVIGHTGFTYNTGQLEVTVTNENHRSGAVRITGPGLDTTIHLPVTDPITHLPSYSTTINDIVYPAGVGSYTYTATGVRVDGSTLLFSTKVTVVDLDITDSRELFVPGKPNVIDYFFTAPNDFIAQYGKLQIFYGTTLLHSANITDLSAGNKSIVYSGTEISTTASKQYRALISVGSDTDNVATAEVTFEVIPKKVNFYFNDIVTQQDIDDASAAEAESPASYEPEADGYETERDPNYKLCSGINPATITDTQVNIKYWYDGQNEDLAQSPSSISVRKVQDISVDEWTNTLGYSLESKTSSIKLGCVLVDYSNDVYAMDDYDGESVTFKITVAENGFCDYAGNQFDADTTTPERENVLIITGRFLDDGSFVNLD